VIFNCNAILILAASVQNADKVANPLYLDKLFDLQRKIKVEVKMFDVFLFSPVFEYDLTSMSWT
jgi:hypothetical protein